MLKLRVVEKRYMPMPHCSRILSGMAAMCAVGLFLLPTRTAADPPSAETAKPAPAPDLRALFQMHYANRVRSFQEQNLMLQNVVLVGDSITEGFEVTRYFPGRRVLNRGIGADVTLAFPSLLLLIAVAAAVRPSLPVICVVIGLVGWAGMARLVRGQVLVVRSLDYVQAGRALGLSDGRLVTRHILPNVLAPVIVAATLGIGGAIMAEAALSFVGLGAQPPTPSWGAMVADGRDLLRVAPWVSLFPGLAIGAAVLGLNLVGDGLRDALDVRA